MNRCTDPCAICDHFDALYESRLAALEEREQIRDEAVDDVADKILGKGRWGRG